MHTDDVVERDSVDNFVGEPMSNKPHCASKPVFSQLSKYMNCYRFYAILY